MGLLHGPQPVERGLQILWSVLWNSPLTATKPPAAVVAVVVRVVDLREVLALVPVEVCGLIVPLAEHRCGRQPD